VCLLAAFLFALHVTCVQVHILTEAHCEVATPAHAASHAHPEGHHAHGDHEDLPYHPHSAADHEFQLTCKRPMAVATVAAVLTETCLRLTPPEAPATCPVLELIVRLAEAPPDPAQPRAPPTV
jgi:hypothetical protein